MCAVRPVTLRVCNHDLDLNHSQGEVLHKEAQKMAKRRIVLSSQEMNDIKKRIETLESQLSRSNTCVAELESGLNEIKDVACGKDAVALPEQF